MRQHIEKVYHTFEMAEAAEYNVKPDMKSKTFCPSVSKIMTKPFKTYDQWAKS